MVRFKNTIYGSKVQKEALALTVRTLKGEDVTDEVIALASPLVLSWHYLDVETNQPIPPGEPGELTLMQASDFKWEFLNQVVEEPPNYDN